MNSQTASTQQQTNFAQQIGSVLSDMVERWRERLSELVLPLINHLAMQKQLDQKAIGQIARMVQKHLSQRGAPVSESQIVSEINAAAAKVVPIVKSSEVEELPDESHFTPAQKLHIEEFFGMADTLLSRGDAKAYKQLLLLAEEDKILKPYHVEQLRKKERAVVASK